MSWHRAGTIAVTNGSTTVTGVNTSFAANTRVGDAFIGPDGRQYELQNVASDTVISILPAYAGPTASGQAYAIVPVQGYQKGLADQVRDWTNQYGPKMAALGTTGNYDVLPVAKGGTGGADQASARAGLGLGTAATANITTSSTDSTAGRVMTVGDFGLGGKAAVTVASADTVAGAGIYRITDSTPGGPGFFGSLWHHQHDADAFVQMAISIIDGAPWTRKRVGGITSSWARTTTEFVSNANGSAVKFADGTMIAYAEGTSMNATNPVGSLFFSGWQLFNFPVAFLSRPVVVPTIAEREDHGGISTCFGANTTNMYIGFYLPTNTGKCKLAYIAIGRWK
ncbi:hypothetical protein QL104_19740 [Pseudomonas piscis]|uniref:Phage tail protein n=1 Tax=Pseudomonas piscis TaxID=2614538 RepID=A0ABY9NB62_9PSED|nr:hypothetical protein [Pseudomonas piscis]WMN15591.1 hypothetical protein QL104_19740 [Pseudomonas piscis]